VALLYLFLLNLVGAVRRDLSRPAVRGTEPSSPLAASGQLIVVDGGSSGLKTGLTVPLTPETTIGRSAHNSVRLNGAFVSGRHAVVHWKEGRWYLEDLQSTNGTLLNRTPLERDEALEFGDVIEIGDVKLKLAP
jgi:pSer/pThr/pTyr-binding forkhead associated (FHA) protein